MSELQRAIDHLGATDLGDGRYAFRVNPTLPWRAARAHALIQYSHARRVNAEPRVLGGLLDGTIRMPTWWSPAQPFTHRCDVCDELMLPNATDHLHGGKQACFHLVTVDLATGKEIRE
jgi:hypothetical protein